MREILFRGKCKKGDRWIEGFLFQTYYESFEWCISTEPLSANDYSEIIGDWAEVIPETLGQFIGLTDKNGKKIFEGDVIANSCGIKETVEFYKGRYYPFIAFPEYNCWDEKECEIIGNIHDNPK